MKQQTAVEWLVDQLKKQGYLYDLDIEAAKQMEKEQIVNAYIDGSYTGCGCYDYMNGKDAQEYYSKKYNK